jgi:predicted dehydrogenase
VWVSDARGRTASLVEFPEGVVTTDVWTIPGEERFADVFGPRGAYDIPLADVHRHLVPYHARQVEDFVDAVRHGREPSVTGQEAVKSLRIVRAIYESSWTGATVAP